MRALAVVAVLLLAGCGDDGGGRIPVARLSVPACVLAGSTVKLDASGSTDPGKSIVRYLFAVDDGVVLVSNQPALHYRFGAPKIVDDRIEQYLVRLEVENLAGFRSQAQAHLFVVFDLEQCSSQPLPDGDDDLRQAPVDAVEDSDDQELPGAVEATSEQDEQQPDVSGPCPNISGSYRVQVFCYGSVHVEMEMAIVQEPDCSFGDEFGIVYGEVDGQGTVHLQSDFADLNISDCQGPYDDPENFALQCTSGCTAIFILNEF